MIYSSNIITVTKEMKEQKYSDKSCSIPDQPLTGKKYPFGKKWNCKCKTQKSCIHKPDWFTTNK